MGLAAGAAARCALAAVGEYCATELLELSASHCFSARRATITTRSVSMAVLNDEELERRDQVEGARIAFFGREVHDHSSQAFRNRSGMRGGVNQVAGQTGLKASLEGSFVTRLAQRNNIRRAA